MSPLLNSSNSTESHYKKTVMVMVTVSVDVWEMGSEKAMGSAKAMAQH